LETMSLRASQAGNEISCAGEGGRGRSRMNSSLLLGSGLNGMLFPTYPETL
jgi:hypothetical protein